MRLVSRNDHQRKLWAGKLSAAFCFYDKKQIYGYTVWYEIMESYQKNNGKFFKMRNCRLVPGSDLYLYGINSEGRLEADGKNVPSDVSHIRFGKGVDRWISDRRLTPVDQAVRHGMLYMVLIFLVEYATGAWLTTRGMCPWDYSGRPSNINGLIRLDFAPLWFGTGLLFENLTKERVNLTKNRLL